MAGWLSQYMVSLGIWYPGSVNSCFNHMVSCPAKLATIYLADLAADAAFRQEMGINSLVNAPANKLESVFHVDTRTLTLFPSLAILISIIISILL